MRFLLDLAHDLKRAKYSGTERPRLTSKNIALIFEKASTRTRCSFEVAAHDQGAHVTYLGPEGSHIGSTESMRDAARVSTTIEREPGPHDQAARGQQGLSEAAKTVAAHGNAGSQADSAGSIPVTRSTRQTRCCS